MCCSFFLSNCFFHLALIYNIIVYNSLYFLNNNYSTVFKKSIKTSYKIHKQLQNTPIK
jgi:hypothetical protein